MAKFKAYDYRQRVFLPVFLEDQLMPGTLEFAIHTLAETRLGRPGLDRNFDAGEVLLGHPAGRERDPGQPQGREQPLQFFHRQPQVNQGPQGHIAAHARETVKKRPALMNSQKVISPSP
jgi:hypothetical protein